MKNWVKLQEENECIFSIVDLHAITVDYPKEDLPKRIINATKDALAVGIDPEKSILFRQSDILEHTELAWLLNTIATMGELNRMTQYKEKSEKHEQRVGLFDYPVLMAADILLYKTDGVPVGEDQVQHVELARDLANRFNSKFGETFPVPKALLTETKRIMSLDGAGKMSKSNAPSTYISLDDDAETITKKISAATTDDGKSAEISPATKNLFGLLEVFAGKNVADNFIDQREAGTIKYSEMKPVLADAIIKELAPIQKRRNNITDDNVKKILSDGAAKLRKIASDNMTEIKQKMGLSLIEN
jgi:tryptophanyl-tRNA synthetase